jgi:hypothetical protein
MTQQQARQRHGLPKIGITREKASYRSKARFDVLLLARTLWRVLPAARSAAAVHHDAEW